MAVQFTSLERKLLVGAYKSQRDHAARRGIEFLLTYDEWLDIWGKSGKMLLRGAKAGCYCMGRDGDTGPYAVGNVSIIPIEKNHSDGSKGKSYPKSAETRRKLSEAARGRPRPIFSKETRTKISAALKGKPKSEQHKAKLRAKATGRFVPDEVGAKISKALRGKPKSIQASINMSAGQFKRWKRQKRRENRVRL